MSLGGRHLVVVAAVRAQNGGRRATEPWQALQAGLLEHRAADGHHAPIALRGMSDKVNRDDGPLGHITRELRAAVPCRVMNAQGTGWCRG